MATIVLFVRRGDMEKITVIGAGLMGHGIAQVFAANGHAVAVYDPNAEALAQVPERVRENLRALGHSESAARHIALHLTLHENLSTAAAEADFVFEAAPEKLPLKQQIFEQLSQCTGPDCILASNTSVIPITEIAANLTDRHRVIGAHWWNPPYLVPLVEVVQSPASDSECIGRCIDLLRRVGKTPVHVRRDVPGFIGNRLMHALWREAISIVNAGICDAPTVDLVVKNSFGMRLPVLGPLENADLVGLDLTLDIQNIILPHLEASGQPNPLLTERVNERQLGMKTGRGFYQWTPESAQAVRDRLTQHLRKAVKIATASK
jgi:3-hydroxybutyryl-CoA dehydrogenase